MKIIGFLISLFAFILALYALVMDVSVPSSLGNRIINVHLVTQQQNILTISFMLLLFGLILIFLGKKSKDLVITKDGEVTSESYTKIPTEKGFNYILKKKDGVSFNIIRSNLLELYIKEGFEIKEDSKESIFMKKTENKAYIDAKDKGSSVTLSIWNATTPNFIEKLYNIKSPVVSSGDKLIEFSKMLEKGIISEAEFLTLKNELIK